MLDFRGNDGFTLIELLIVIIVVGILSAIALPAFLNQASKARQSEAKTYIGSMNRAHQADYLQRGSFTNSVSDLGLGIQTETAAYIYRITAGSTPGASVVNRAIPSDGSFSNSPNTQSTSSAYIGGVKVGSVTTIGSDVGAMSVLCEAISPPIVSNELGTIAEPNNLSSSVVGAPTCDPLAYRAIE